MLEALAKNLGVVTPALAEVGIVRSTYYEWLKNDEEFRAQVEDMPDLALDFAESQLLQNIKSGSDACVIFYMKTKGKKRGYIERNELTGKEGESLFKSATEEELKLILNRYLSKIE